VDRDGGDVRVQVVTSANPLVRGKQFSGLRGSENSWRIDLGASVTMERLAPFSEG
jgi:hypothetical protein